MSALRTFADIVWTVSVSVSLWLLWREVDNLRDRVK